MIRKLLGAALGFGVLAGAAPAFAASVILDGGFEVQAAGVGNYCYYGAATPGGPACAAGPWSGSGAGFQDENNIAWPGEPDANGSKYAFVQSTGYFEQLFTADTTGSYVLTFFDAGRPTFNVCCQGNQDYQVLVNNVVVGSFSTTTDQPFTARSTNAFSVVSGENYLVRFQGQSPSDNTAFINDVALAAVPEPGTWALMIMGFGAAGAVMRRRRQLLATA